jgi:hypothetical protein
MPFLRHIEAPGYLKERFGRSFNEGKNRPPWVKKERDQEEKVVVHVNYLKRQRYSCKSRGRARGKLLRRG